jgi:hypothetical protein
MADAGLFTSWGENITGREAAGLECFDETLRFWQDQKDAGRIESFEVALLGPSGGDLDGFIFARGDAMALEEIRESDQFTRLVLRAQMVVHHVRVLPARINSGLEQGINLYREELQAVSV